MLYQGLKDKVFYWELINTIRKSLMVAINVFMSTVPLVYTAVTAVLALIGIVGSASSYSFKTLKTQILASF